MNEANEAAAGTPAVKGGVVACLHLDGAMRAAEFYVRAFGAEIMGAMPPDARGRTPHVHVYLNGSSLMLPVDDIHAWWDRAIAAGAEGVMPVAEMFWGDLYGQLRDPFGVTWALDQPKAAAA